MTSLDFLYISLGVGFLLLVIFLCVLIVFLILILRDVNKTTENVRQVSEKVNEYVTQPIQLLEHFAKRFAILAVILQKIKEYTHHDEEEGGKADFKYRKVK